MYGRISSFFQFATAFTQSSISSQYIESCCNVLSHDSWLACLIPAVIMLQTPGARNPHNSLEDSSMLYHAIHSLASCSGEAIEPLAALAMVVPLIDVFSGAKNLPSRNSKVENDILGNSQEKSKKIINAIVALCGPTVNRTRVNSATSYCDTSTL
jgi:hypothetical protein